VEITIDRRSSVPLYLQIRGAIRALILGRKLPEGFRLPPERRLAQALGVNRSTVLGAYDELKAEGLIDAHVGRGTTVLLPRVGGGSASAPVVLQPLPWRQLLCGEVMREPDPLVRDLLQLAERREVISLAVGLPAPELIPLKLVRRLTERLIARHGAEVLLHSPTEGASHFRETLARHMALRGVRCGPAEILVTSGSQQGFDLVLRALVSPGDAVVVEEPTFFGALTALRSAQAKLLGVPVDGEGVRTEILEMILSRHRPKLIYTQPTFQNPSGGVMSLERRRHLLELSYRYQVPIVEDDPYSELRYAGTPVPSLRALDEHGHVIYLGSFSKVLFPGLRVGWLVAPRALVRQLALIRQAIDLHPSTFGQWIINELIVGGHLGRHIRDLRTEYVRRRDATVAALRAGAAEHLSWTTPEGGFYVWCRVADDISRTQLLLQGGRQRVAYLPGAACFPEEHGEHWLRVNFTFAPPQKLRLGLMRLAKALRAAAAESHADGERAVGTRPIV
jgi:DNA-binding transcriptional MocR family regulator